MLAVGVPVTVVIPSKQWTLLPVAIGTLVQSLHQNLSISSSRNAQIPFSIRHPVIWTPCPICPHRPITTASFPWLFQLQHRRRCRCGICPTPETCPRGPPMTTLLFPTTLPWDSLTLILRSHQVMGHMLVSQETVPGWRLHLIIRHNSSRHSSLNNSQVSSSSRRSNSKVNNSRHSNNRINSSLNSPQENSLFPRSLPLVLQ